MRYRNRSNSYSGDPRWIIAKYAGTSANGVAFKSGDRVFYYPKPARVLAGEAAEQAARDFEAAKSDEAFYNGY